MLGEIFKLNQRLEKQEEERTTGAFSAEKLAFKMGHASVVKEVAKLWTSKEYTAELTFGLFNLAIQLASLMWKV